MSVSHLSQNKNCDWGKNAFSSEGRGSRGFFCTPSLFKVCFISFSDLLKPRKLTLNVGMKRKITESYTRIRRTQEKSELIIKIYEMMRQINNQ